jgi:hypothetical protein
MPKNSRVTLATAKHDPFKEEFYKGFNEAWQILDEPEPFFDGASAREYWNACRTRFNLISGVNPSNKDWHSTYDSGITRNKTLTLFAQAVGQNFQPDITAQNRHQMVDKHASMFIKDIVEQSFDKEKWDIKRFWQQLTTFVEGTSVMEECYGSFKQKSKEIEEIDFETGEAKVREVEAEVFKGAYVQVIPNEQFLTRNPYIRDVQEQDEVYVYYRMSDMKFQSLFGGYRNASEVQPGLSRAFIDENDIFKNYSKLVGVTEKEVMVIKRFRKSDDTLTIYANGVRLTAENNPIPRPVTDRRAKRYPFIIEMAEPIDNDFQYGKSVVDRLAKVANDLNVLWRIMVDREVIKNIPPIETTNEALLNEDLVVPGNIIHKAREQDTTQVIPGLFQGMDGGLPSLIQMLEREGDNNTVSQLTSGQQQSGANPTATQTLAMAKNAQTMLNMFSELQRHSVAAMAELRAETLVWRVKIDKDYQEELPLITVHEKVLASGKTGSRSYALSRGISKETEEAKLELSKKFYKLEEDAKGVIEFVAVDPDELLDLDLYVTVGAEPAPRKNTDLEKMMAMEKFAFYSQRPDLFNLEPAATDVAIALGDDPDEVTVKKQQNPMAQQGMEQPQPVENPLKPNLQEAMGAPKNSALGNMAQLTT